ncbi:hypothetical protein ACFLRZ_05090, partial [Bacteroidota bacterium]
MSQLELNNWKYKGACISGYYADAFNNNYVYQTIDYLKKCGVNTIQIVVTWYQDEYNSNKIYKHKRKSIKDRDLIKIIQYIHKKGLKVNLNPHVDPIPNSNEWRAKIVPNDVSAWFDNYKMFLAHFLQISINNNIDLFTIGTEMVSMTRPEYYNYWSELVAFLKNYNNKSYKGKLTYIADKTEVFGMSRFFLGDNKVINVEVLNSRFWQLFDYISISAFYEVGNLKQSTPDINSVLESWNNKWVKKLEQWKNNLNIDKKVIIGEIGYRSVDCSHIAPALHYETIESNEKYHFNQKIQENCFEGMFDGLSNIDWIEGIFIWEEEINAPPIYHNKKNKKFSIINKGAAQIIARYYRNNN